MFSVHPPIRRTKATKQITNSFIAARKEAKLKLTLSNLFLRFGMSMSALNCKNSYSHSLSRIELHGTRYITPVPILGYLSHTSRKLNELNQPLCQGKESERKEQREENRPQPKYFQTFFLRLNVIARKIFDDIFLGNGFDAWEKVTKRKKELEKWLLPRKFIVYILHLATISIKSLAYSKKSALISLLSLKNGQNIMLVARFERLEEIRAKLLETTQFKV